MIEYIERAALNAAIADWIIEDSYTTEEKAFNRGLHRAQRLIYNAPVAAAVDDIESIIGDLVTAKELDDIFKRFEERKIRIVLGG